MMMIKNKILWMLGLSLALMSCNEETILPEIEAEEVSTTEISFVNNGDADFSNFVAIGASFTAGFTDNALFEQGQINSFPNILANIFAELANGGEFNQPLMDDNIGGLLFNGSLDSDGGFLPRLYFDGEGPASLAASPTFVLPTTEATSKLTGTFKNLGVPGAKSYHLGFNGYGSLAGLAMSAANPYFVRFSSGETTSVLTDALTQQPTFFTLIDGGGNDVLGYALAGGGILNGEQAENQSGNIDPTSYGTWDITDPIVFENTIATIISALTANGAKGVIGNVPNVTSLAHFTTVPYNPLNPVGDLSLIHI